MRDPDLEEPKQEREPPLGSRRSGVRPWLAVLAIAVFVGFLLILVPVFVLSRPPGRRLLALLEVCAGGLLGGPGLILGIVGYLLREVKRRRS